MEDLKVAAQPSWEDRFAALVQEWVELESCMTEAALAESKIIEQGEDIGAGVTSDLDRICDDYNSTLTHMLTLADRSAIAGLTKLNMWLHIQGYRPQDRANATLADQLAFQAIDELNTALSWRETIYAGMIDPQVCGVVE